MRLMFAAAHVCDTILREKVGCHHLVSYLGSSCVPCILLHSTCLLQVTCGMIIHHIAWLFHCQAPAALELTIIFLLQADAEQQLKEVLGRTIAHMEGQLAAQQQQVEELQHQLAQQQAAAEAATQVRLHHV